MNLLQVSAWQIIAWWFAGSIAFCALWGWVGYAWQKRADAVKRPSYFAAVEFPKQKEPTRYALTWFQLFLVAAASSAGGFSICFLLCA